ncbi:hypothetical protein [Pseudonocardia sp. GCM10023141]|uniref:hypothetical protein n=1 Tax=Pseudonocardia sp. GCM10023141 TaxID=3252653 RepID=UPI0036077053
MKDRVLAVQRAATTSNVEQLRATYVNAARAYWGDMTAESSSGRTAAWVATVRAGVPVEAVRDWDTAVANDIFVGLFPRPCGRRCQW